MSRLEEKLSASIKPAKGKTGPAGKSAVKGPRPPVEAARPMPPARRAKPPETSAVPAAEAEDRARSLHPRRIWPD